MAESGGDEDPPQADPPTKVLVGRPTETLVRPATSRRFDWEKWSGQIVVNTVSGAMLGLFAEDILPGKGGVVAWCIGGALGFAKGVVQYPLEYAWEKIHE